MHSLVFLIGYRGCGKTTVAKELAKQLKYECVDSDQQVETRAGKRIAEIFSEEGEAAFRDLESKAIAEICERQKTVVALGGGAVLREENRNRLAKAGVVVWLTASVDTLAERLAADSATLAMRPNLTAAGGKAEIAAILSERTPLYRQCATLVIDTEGKRPTEIAKEISTQLDRTK